MSKVVFYNNGQVLNEGREILGIFEDSFNGQELFEGMEKCINSRPKLRQWYGDENEYYPQVYVCIDGKDYLIKESKFIKEEK